MQNSEQIWQIVDSKREDYVALADRVWGTPELAYGERRSVAEHVAMLEQEGFRVTREVAGIPTAVMGEAGDEGPVIAILGEYDALPGLSQEAGWPSRARSRARAASAMAAATTCSARPRCWRRPRSRTGSRRKA